MNSTIFLLTGGIIILIFFIFLHFYNFRKVKAGKREKGKVRKLIIKNKIDLGLKEIINNQFIGFDRSKRVLLLSQLDKDKENLTVIPISTVAYCKLDNQTIEVVHRGRNRTVSEALLSKISILLFSATKKLLFEFVFFDQEKNALKELPYLAKRAEYWKKLIMKTGIVEVV